MERLKSHKDFVAVLKQRKKVSSRNIVIHYRFDADNAGAQRYLGLAVSKQVGNAVLRNRVKRRFRVIAKQYELLLPEGCHIVMRAKPNTSIAHFSLLEEQVKDLFQLISKKYINPKNSNNVHKLADKIQTLSTVPIDSDVQVVIGENVDNEVKGLSI
ncbi:MAG: ribonuclease P protein component [Bifidobacteriaceae bacterium]|nr:ribonuclease P protein component [Bifidobacteriaceae bacterium]